MSSDLAGAGALAEEAAGTLADAWAAGAAVVAEPWGVTDGAMVGAAAVDAALTLVAAAARRKRGPERAERATKCSGTARTECAPDTAARSPPSIAVRWVAGMLASTALKRGGDDLAMVMTTCPTALQV